MTYKEFIDNVLEARGRFACGDEYHERHHIVPKCMGGTNDEDNLIDLFAREHFEAHRLLALENPDIQGLVYAWWAMSTHTNQYTKERYCLTPEEYEEVKMIYSKCNAERLKKYWKDEENKKKTGKKISEALSTEEQKKLRSELSIKYWSNKENRLKASVRNKDFWQNNEKRQCASECSKKYWSDESNRKNFGNSRRGKNNPMYGKGQTEAHIQKRVDKISKPIFCITTNTVYKSGKEASDITMANARHICGCCRGERKTAGGFIWRYLYDQTSNDGTIIPGAISLGLITQEEVDKQLNNTKLL